MDLQDLSVDEKRMLVGLSLAIAGRDRIGSEANEVMDALVTEIGPDLFNRLCDEVAETMPTEAAVRDAVGSVDRVDAREIIVGTLYEIAEAGSITEAEAQLLHWLAGAWGIKVSDASDEPYRT